MGPRVTARGRVIIDQDAFQRFQQGDQEAMTQVVLELQDRLVAYLRLCTGSVETAEELAQEAFIRLHRERRKIHGPEKLLPWIMITGRRLAIKEMKRSRYRSEFTVAEGALDGLSPAHGPFQMDHILEKQLQQVLVEELNGLRPRDREILALRFFAGLQIKEIAETLSLPMGSVGVYLKRALERLRRRLEERGHSFEDFT